MVNCKAVMFEHAANGPPIRSADIERVVDQAQHEEPEQTLPPWDRNSPAKGVRRFNYEDLHVEQRTRTPVFQKTLGNLFKVTPRERTERKGNMLEDSPTEPSNLQVVTSEAVIKSARGVSKLRGRHEERQEIGASEGKVESEPPNADTAGNESSILQEGCDGSKSQAHISVSDGTIQDGKDQAPVEDTLGWKSPNEETKGTTFGKAADWDIELAKSVRGVLREHVKKHFVAEARNGSGSEGDRQAAELGLQLTFAEVQPFGYIVRVKNKKLHGINTENETSEAAHQPDGKSNRNNNNHNSAMGGDGTGARTLIQEQVDKEIRRLQKVVMEQQLRAGEGHTHDMAAKVVRAVEEFKLQVSAKQAVSAMRRSKVWGSGALYSDSYSDTSNTHTAHLRQDLPLPSVVFSITGAATLGDMRPHYFNSLAASLTLLTDVSQGGVWILVVHIFSVKRAMSSNKTKL